MSSGEFIRFLAAERTPQMGHHVPGLFRLPLMMDGFCSQTCPSAHCHCRGVRWSKYSNERHLPPLSLAINCMFSMVSLRDTLGLPPYLISCGSVNSECYHVSDCKHIAPARAMSANLEDSIRKAQSGSRGRTSEYFELFSEEDDPQLKLNP
jgi:hypothetical protein